jgi:hypothetical protein
MIDSKIDCDTKAVLFGVNAGPLLNARQSGSADGFGVFPLLCSRNEVHEVARVQTRGDPHEHQVSHD